MDHRWDRTVEQQRANEREQERFGARPIARDPDVEKRDREIERLRRVQRSPWDIGAEHWDQRDLYTRSARTDDAGYGVGPRVHPPEGSYAYTRDRVFQESDVAPASVGSSYAREAWPWRNYGFDRARPEEHPGTWDRLRNAVKNAIGLGPRQPWRSDARLLEDVSDALSAHGELDAREIEVTVKDAEVTLEGTVPDRSHKRLAEDVAAACAGVRDVHNRLHIASDDDFFLAPRLVTP